MKGLNEGRYWVRVWYITNPHRPPGFVYPVGYWDDLNTALEYGSLWAEDFPDDIVFLIDTEEEQ